MYNSKLFVNRWVLPHRIILFKSYPFEWRFPLCHQTCRQLQTRDKWRLERIHKKKQDSIARSREALRKLRRQNLEGLSVSTVPKYVQLGERLSKARSISRLLYVYNRNKGDDEAITLSNHVTTLRRLGEVYNNSKEERMSLKKKHFHQKLLRDIIDSVMHSCKELSPGELVDTIVALSRLKWEGEEQFSQFIKEIQARNTKAFTSEEIGMMCFAFGLSNSIQAIELMGKLNLELSCCQLVSFSNSVLSEIAWGFIELKVPANKLLSDICTELLSRDLSLFESRDIALIALGFSRIDVLSENVALVLEKSLYAIIESKKFPTSDLLALTVSLLRTNIISVKMFRRLDMILVSRRDFEETVSKELLEEFLVLLKKSSFNLAESGKIIDSVLHPNHLNSVFDVFFRPRISWKTKVFKQSWFKVY